jgi:hypothetical protein
LEPREYKLSDAQWLMHISRVAFLEASRHTDSEELIKRDNKESKRG